MGAGYTRWFRPGGWIGTFIIWKNAPIEQVPCIRKPKHYKPTYEIVAKPVWPSKKTSILPDDLYPAHTIEYFNFNYYPQAMIDKHTVHKLGEDIYFFTPDIAYIDKATKIKEEQWERPKGLPYVSIDTEPQGTWLGLDRKETKVPTVSKRQRFLEAGGSFSQPTIVATVEGSVWVKKCHVTDSNKCGQEPKYIVPYYGHYHPDPERMSTPTFVKNRTHNFENILQNPDENIWHAARDRKFSIKAHSYKTYSDQTYQYETMADKHLISTMRYLVAAWVDIKNELCDTNRGWGKFAFIYKYLKAAKEAKNAPSFYEIILPCWPTLVFEFVERFGSEALTSVLDRK